MSSSCRRDYNENETTHVHKRLNATPNSTSRTRCEIDGHVANVLHDIERGFDIVPHDYIMAEHPDLPELGFALFLPRLNRTDEKVYLFLDGTRGRVRRDEIENPFLDEWIKGIQGFLREVAWSRRELWTSTHGVTSIGDLWCRAVWCLYVDCGINDLLYHSASSSIDRFPVRRS